MTAPQTAGAGPYRESTPAEDCAAAMDARSRLTPWGLVALVAVLGVVAAVSGHSEHVDRSRRIVDAPRYHRAASLWAAHAYPERTARAVCGDGVGGRAVCVVTVDAVPPIRLRCAVTHCAVEWPEGGR